MSNSSTNAAKFRVGLTGGIASGKSAVSDRLGELGAAVIDTDQLAREVVEPGAGGLEALVAEFGASILGADGNLDRSLLRSRVFADRQARERVNALLHPLIAQLMLRRAETASGPYVVFVVPLLVESGFQAFADRVLVVDCEESVQIDRLLSRDGGSESEARSILAAQADREVRLAAADDVIINHGDLATLARQVDYLHALYTSLAAAAA